MFQHNRVRFLLLAGLVGIGYQVSTTSALSNHDFQRIQMQPRSADLCKDENVCCAPNNKFVIEQKTRFVANGPEWDGQAIQCDLPTQEHLRNSVGRDGLGLCVFTSIDLAAKWANEPALIGFRDFMKRQPGGGWPEKVDRYIPLMAQSKGLPTPAYVQHTGGDAEFLKLALKTGRYVSVTYNGRDGVFYSGPIAHMVNLVHLSPQWAVIQDNNFPGQWLWMPQAEFLSRWKGSGGGWAVVLLKPGPPPIPVNPIVTNQAVEPIRSDFSSTTSIPKEPLHLYHWKPDQNYPGYFYLYHQEKQIGTWHPDDRGYHELQTDGSWSERKEPPIPLPVGVIPNFGIDAERISSQSTYQLNGKAVSRQEAFLAMNGLTDDSGKCRLTIVGNATTRQQVLRDLLTHPDLLLFQDRLLIQDYEPDHWAVRGVGFAPGITLQSAPNSSGQAVVLFRFPEYRGPELLATALRKADPTYRPDRDPDPAKPSLPSFTMPNLPPAIWVLVGFLLVFLFKSKERS